MKDLTFQKEMNKTANQISDAPRNVNIFDTYIRRTITVDEKPLSSRRFRPD